MSIANNTYRIFNDGTSQDQRWMEALAADFAQVDDRTRDDLLEEMRCWAPQLAYYNDQDQWQGDWSTFIPAATQIEPLLAEAKVTQQLPPQLAFLFAFLKAFKHAQNHLNQFTGRHLDFYYEEILQIKHQEAVPDTVHVIFELARGIAEERLAKGSLLKAGKDGNGNPVQYVLQDELVLHPAKVTAIKSVCRDQASGGRIFAAPIANSADGRGVPFDGENASWAPLGESQLSRTVVQRSMEEAEVGFIITSPSLNMSGGKRECTLELFFVPVGISHPYNNAEVRDAFRLWLSTEEGWKEVKPVYTKVGSTNSFRINWALTPDFPPITSLPEKDALSWGRVGDAALKLVLNHQAPNYAYNVFHDIDVDIDIERIRFEAQVQGVEEVQLSNDDATINAEKSFFPFSAQPAIGSAFYIGCSELMDKRVDSLALHQQWDKLPTSSNGFADHYAAYAGNRNNNSFRAEVAVFSNNQWAGTGSLPLFATIGNALNQEPYRNTIYTGGFTVQDAQKVARLRLINVDFGHSEFSERYANIALQIAIDEAFQDLPNPPYTPKIKAFTLDYTTSFDITFPSQPGVHRLGHLEPFGDYVTGKGIMPRIVPTIPMGSLYLGITGLNRPRLLQLFLQCEEGSSDADAALQNEDIQWEYLAGNQWQPFPAANILQDGTSGLQKPGIVQLLIEQVSIAESRMLGDLFWLRVSTDGLPEGAARVMDIRLNATAATLQDVEIHAGAMDTNLPAETIKRLVQSQPGIKRTQQPFASFGGRSAENQAAYYRRVSERLRHKQRAVTAWDYERIVLQAFPLLYKVKCLNHSNRQGSCAPGTVSLVVIPKVDITQNHDPFRPKASAALREEISEFLHCLIPNIFVTVQILNPCYEPIEVVAKVQFKPGYDPGFYLKELNSSLQRLLAPWAFEEAEDIAIGGQIYGSSIIKYMEQQPYIEHICDFQLRHYPCRPCLGEMSIGDGVNNYADDFTVYPLKTDPVVASSPSSVLVSANIHQLSLATADDPCQCQVPEYTPCGIGEMKIEQDFKIAKTT